MHARLYSIPELACPPPPPPSTLYQPVSVERLKNHGPGIGELIRRATRQPQPQWLDRRRHLPPSLSPDGARCRHRQFRRPKNFHHLLQRLKNLPIVVVDGASALKTSVAEPVFWRHVHRRVTASVNPIHRVAARIKRVLANESILINVVNPRHLRHLSAG